MKPLERTRQQLDPVGTLSGRPLAVLLAIAAFYYGLGMSLTTLKETSNLALAILALLWLAGAAAIVIAGTSPRRAPFTKSMHIAVHLLMLIAIALSAASQWGMNQMVQDDFGAVSLGVLILAMGPYRPAMELAATGSISAVFIGFLTLMQAPSFSSPVPPVAFVLAAMLPMLALTYASAAYSGGLVGSLEQWQAGATKAVASRANELLGTIARSVQHDRIAVLSHDVLPFFEGILRRASVAESDRLRAREISESIRAIMVAEADRTWLEVVARDDGVESTRLAHVVIDKRGLASQMVPEQRIALRALIIALLEEPAEATRTMYIELVERDEKCWGTITASIDTSDFVARSLLAPHFVVMQIVFADFQVEEHRPILTLKFSYAQR